MKKISLQYFLIITIFNNVKGLDASQSNQQLRNQLAFAYVCQENMLDTQGHLFTDGSTNLNYLYGKLKRTQLSLAARDYTYPVDTDIYYNLQVIEWLLTRKADPHILDNTGRSAALWSICPFQGKNEHPIKLFLKNDSKNIDQVYEITNLNDLFVAYQPKVTLLTTAVLSNGKILDDPQARYNLVRTLLEFGPNRNLAPNGETALQIAIRLEDAEMVKILQE